MKGLLYKDFCLILKNFRMVLVSMLLFSLLNLNSNTSGITFAAGYMLGMGSLLVFSSISVDYAENGMAFLMTLPVTRRLYVIEKYLFAFLNTTGFFLLWLCTAGIFSMIRHISLSGETIISGIVIYIFMLFILGILLPVNLKFGPEKARYIMMFFYAFIILSVALGGKYLKSLFMTAPFAGISGWCFGSSVFFLLLIVLLTALFLLSPFISIRIMKKKEF